MRATEFLFEADLAPSELRKHAGKYIKTLVRKIEDGEPIEIVPDKQPRYGETVILNKENVEFILKAWFGTAEFPDVDKMNLAPNGDVIPADKNVAKLVLTTTAGDELTFGALQKTAEFKGGKTFNAGDIGEGMLGAAVTAKFLARENDITEKDVLNVLKKLGDGELVGKNNMKGSTADKSANDKVYYNLALNQANYNALIGAAKSPSNMHPEILGALRSAVIFANGNAGVAAALNKIIKDKGENSVVVSSDGVSDQTGTKADLFLDVDGTTVNLLSLKAGDVKQFGQASGYNFAQLDKFFNETFGVNIPNDLEADFVDGDPVTSFEATHKVYNMVAQDLQRELSGESTVREASFIERMYRGIKHHATRGDDQATMVILKTTPNAAGYSELQFGQALRDAMENVDLDMTYDAPGQRKPAKIEIFGKSPNGERAMLLRMRSNFKSEGKGYVRNIVEMGPLLKILALIEKRQAEK